MTNIRLDSFTCMLLRSSRKSVTGLYSGTGDSAAKWSLSIAVRNRQAAPGAIAASQGRNPAVRQLSRKLAESRELALWLPVR